VEHTLRQSRWATDTATGGHPWSRRTWLKLVGLGAGAALLNACAPSSSPGGATASPTGAPTAAPLNSGAKPTQPATPTTATQVMNWYAQSAHGGQYAAVVNGYYNQVNLNMTTDQGGPNTPTIPLVASGKYMFGLMASDQILLARQDGVPVVAIFAPFQTSLSGLMYHQSHPLADFPDLQGRKVYVTTAADYWLYLVAKYKLDQTQQMTYSGQLATFMADESAVTQCFLSSEPVAATQQGAQIGTLRVADSGFNPYVNVIGTNEQTIRDQPDVVQAFVTASLAGWKAYVANPTATLAYIKEQNKDTDPEQASQAATIEKPLVLGPTSDPKAIGTLTQQRFKDLHDQLREVNMLKADLDYNAAFDGSFVTAAHNAAT
jgi:NitT/TauT family transport system substrate-binding protein